MTTYVSVVSAHCSNKMKQSQVHGAVRNGWMKGDITMFCINCGNELNKNARFCAACGTALQPQPALAPVILQNAPEKKLQKKGLKDLLVIPAAIILLLMGIGYMALMLLGGTITAQVTGYEQVLILKNDDSTRNPSRYKLEYRFAVNNERYDGSVTRVFEKGSHLQKTLRVRYLPFWPHVNAEADTMGMVLAGPMMIGVGILMLVFGVKKKTRIRI